MISQEAGEEIKRHTSEVQVQRQRLAHVASLNPSNHGVDRKQKFIAEKSPRETQRREKETGRKHACAHTYTHTHMQLMGDIPYSSY